MLSVTSARHKRRVTRAKLDGWLAPALFLRPRHRLAFAEISFPRICSLAAFSCSVLQRD